MSPTAGEHAQPLAPAEGMSAGNSGRIVWHLVTFEQPGRPGDKLG